MHTNALKSLQLVLHLHFWSIVVALHFEEILTCMEYIKLLFLSPFFLRNTLCHKQFSGPKVSLMQVLHVAALIRRSSTSWKFRGDIMRSSCFPDLLVYCIALNVLPLDCLHFVIFRDCCFMFSPANSENTIRYGRQPSPEETGDHWRVVWYIALWGCQWGQPAPSLPLVTP